MSSATIPPTTELRDAVVHSHSTNAPILHHLNADTTWLLQIPRPDSDSKSRHFFNILLDPWLTGSQSDVASWFSQQWHLIMPALGSIAEVEDLCHTVEDLASAMRPLSTTQASVETFIDAIAISHEFTDHCHKETLLQCSPATPVIGATKAAALVRGWKHFNTVYETPAFTGGDWREQRLPGVLPDWLAITRLVNERDALYYHSAVMIAFGNSASDPEEADTLVYTPHGIHAASLSVVASATPQLTTRAILHGLHDVSIDWGQQLNLGAINGLAAQRMLGARYWIGTHDEVKKGGGLVSWLLRRKVYTVRDALEQEAKKKGEVWSEKEGGLLEGGKYLELGNGERVVLV